STLHLYFYPPSAPPDLLSFPTRRSSDLSPPTISASSFDSAARPGASASSMAAIDGVHCRCVTPCCSTLPATEARPAAAAVDAPRSEEHTSELQSLAYLVCRLLLEKKKND